MAATKVAKKGMSMPEIRKKAKALGITPGKLKKAELIHTIQVTEGCTPCFGRTNGSNALAGLQFSFGYSRPRKDQISTGANEIFNFSVDSILSQTIRSPPSRVCL